MLLNKSSCNKSSSKPGFNLLSNRQDEAAQVSAYDQRAFKRAETVKSSTALNQDISHQLSLNVPSERYAFSPPNYHTTTKLNKSSKNNNQNSSDLHYSLKSQSFFYQQREALSTNKHPFFFSHENLNVCATPTKTVGGGGQL